MTRIQFYILASETLEDRWHYAQRLILQSLHSGKSVYVHTACSRDTRMLQDKLENNVPERDERVLVDHRGEPESERHVLVNLSEEVPYFFSSFETTLEVIHDEPAAKAVARERYRYYQERGYPLHHHEIQPQLAIL